MRKQKRLNLQLRAIGILSNPKYRALGEDKVYFGREEQNEILTDFLMECVDLARDIKGAKASLGETTNNLKKEF